MLGDDFKQILPVIPTGGTNDGHAKIVILDDIHLKFFNRSGWNNSAHLSPMDPPDDLS